MSNDAEQHQQHIKALEDELQQQVAQQHDVLVERCRLKDLRIKALEDELRQS